MGRKYLFAYALALCTMFAALQLQAEGPAPTQKQAAAQAGKKTAVAATPPQQHGEGQRVFEQNCSRCHAAPSGFSSRISGTVAMHMRVRASLSQDDTEALLHFLNP